MSSDPPSVTGDRRSLGRAGFEAGSEAYERARPSYPDEAVTRLEGTTGILPGARVLDLAAGTGKLTRRLAADGATCVAVEPSASMRAVFQQKVPGVAVAGGTAEMIPLRTGCMDAVVVAQAFHWFDPQLALADIARVLRRLGWLALVWNERDESDPAVAELVRITKWDRCQPYPMGKDFGQEIDRSGRFGPVTRTKHRFVQELDLDAYVDQVASRSYVQVMAEPERQTLLAAVATFGATLGQPIRVPYITDLFCAPRLD